MFRSKDGMRRLMSLAISSSLRMFAAVPFVTGFQGLDVLHQIDHLQHARVARCQGTQCSGVSVSVSSFLMLRGLLPGVKTCLIKPAFVPMICQKVWSRDSSET